MTLDEIIARNDEVRRNAHSLQVLTGRPGLPEQKEFIEARLAFFRSQRRHLNALPKEEYAAALPGAEQEVRTLRNQATVFYGSSSLHVARWQWDAISGDWPGYRAAVAELMPRLFRLLDEEASILHSFGGSTLGS